MAKAGGGIRERKRIRIKPGYDRRDYALVQSALHPTFVRVVLERLSRWNHSKLALRLQPDSRMVDACIVPI